MSEFLDWLDAHILGVLVVTVLYTVALCIGLWRHGRTP